MKVNHDLKTGNSIRLNCGMGHQGEFYVTDTYPNHVKILFGNKKVDFSYEELEQMDAEFVMSELPDSDTVANMLNAYTDSPEEAVNVLWMLCAIANHRLKKQEDYESTLKWVEIEKQLRGIVDP